MHPERRCAIKNENDKNTPGWRPYSRIPMTQQEQRMQWTPYKVVPHSQSINKLADSTIGMRRVNQGQSAVCAVSRNTKEPLLPHT